MGSLDKAFQILFALLRVIDGKVDTILGAVGVGSALGVDKSADGAVERGVAKAFSLGLRDRRGGAGIILAASIDVATATAVLEKSTGVGYSSAGITQPVYVVVDGQVNLVPQFLDGEWAAGNSYQLTSNGVKATIDSDVYGVGNRVWSGVIHETGDLASDLTGLITTSGTGFTTIDGKLVVIDGLLDDQEARPKSVSLITRDPVDISLVLTEITSATKFTQTRQGREAIIIRTRNLVATGATYKLVVNIVRGLDTYQIASDNIVTEVGLTGFEAQLLLDKVLEVGDKVCAFLLSSDAGDTAVAAELEEYEVQ